MSTTGLLLVGVSSPTPAPSCVQSLIGWAMAEHEEEAVEREDEGGEKMGGEEES